MEAVTDPVLARRARVARLVQWGKRIGYGLLLLAIAAFAVGAVGDFTPLLTRVVAVSMPGCTVTLAPAIVFGYAVRAAEREDRQAGR